MTQEFATGIADESSDNLSHFIEDPENFPRRVFGLGHAGIQLARRVFTHDEVVRNVLKPREGQPQRVVVTLLDTAQNERESIGSVVSEIKSVRKRVREELEESADDPLGTLEIQSFILTDSVLLQANHDLAGPDAVETVAEFHSMQCADWFIRRVDINNDLDFNRGVFRRRALAKALYYKAVAEEREVRDLVDMPNNDQAAILTGIGGGTGASLALDVAREVTDATQLTDVTLFGVLPTPLEETRVGANAFAMLSELENVQLAGDSSLFRDIVLSPIDATGYEGKRGNDTNTEALEEFDEAFPFVFTSYYNSREERIFDDSPDFAPFSIAIPQVLRYNIGEIARMQEDLESAVIELQGLLEDQIEMHRQVREIIHQQFTAQNLGLTDDQRSDLESWVGEFESFASRQIFEEFGYTSTSKFTDHLQDARDHEDSIDDQLDHLATLSQDLTQDTLTFVDDFDRTVASVLQRATEFFTVRCETLTDISAVDDDDARESLVELLNAGHGKMREVLLKHNRLKSRLDTLTDDRDTAEEELETVQTELQKARSKRESTIERKLETWRADTSEEREVLQVAAEQSIRKPFQQLESELDSFGKAVISATNESELSKVSESGVQSALDRIEALRDQLRFDDPEVALPPRDAVERSLQTLKDARQASLDTDPDLSLLDKLKPWDTPAEQEAIAARDQLDDCRGTLEMDGIFEVFGTSRASFSYEVTYDVQRGVELIENHLTDVRRDCIGALEDVLEPSLSPEQRTELETRLNQGQSVTSLAESIFDANIPEPTDLEQDAQKIAEQLGTLNQQIEQLDAVEECIDGFVGDDGLRTQIDAAYGEVRSELSGPSQSQPVQSDDEYHYVRSTKPEQLLDIVGQRDLAGAGLLASDSQQQGLSDQIGDFIANIQSSRYNCLRERTISDGQYRYDGHKLHVCFSSLAVDQLPDDHINVVGRLTEAFGLENRADDLDTYRVRFGGPWDVGLCVFIDGVVLDNIRNFREYQQQYEARRQSDDSIHLHHGHGLSDGRFVRRESQVNLNDPQQARLFTACKEETVGEAILENYQTWVDAPTNPVHEEIEAEPDLADDLLDDAVSRDTDDSEPRGASRPAESADDSPSGSVEPTPESASSVDSSEDVEGDD
jgi:hypothetical protein